VNAGQFIQWHDLFVVIDDGSIPLPRYTVIEHAVREQAKSFKQGISMFGILPADAKPPPDEVKRAVKDLFTRMTASISCLAYLIEGTGFKGVAARATLVGMKLFSSRPYPIYVETSLHEALKKIAPHLHPGWTGTVDVNVLAQMIADARMGPIGHHTHGRENFVVK